jgi:hypothetical protein
MLPKMALLIISFATSLFCLSPPLNADSGDITMVIETFVVKQFPTSKSHFWIVNDTHWQTDNEVVVDVNTIVLDKLGGTPTATRYLLLIVGDRLAAAQNIPLDSTVDCQPEQA